MVFQYANNGCLYKYLRKYFSKLTWKTKLQILKDISYELHRIHDFGGYIHANFHSGNILQDQRIYKHIQLISQIWDCLKREVTANVYTFGVIMLEISTRQRSFDGYQFNIELALSICNGLRPKFALGTPEYYIELAKMCMDPNPKNSVVFDQLQNCYEKCKHCDQNNTNDAYYQTCDPNMKLKDRQVEMIMLIIVLKNFNLRHSIYEARIGIYDVIIL
ncbi:kinase-like domain-containing protein [Gigaspora rosea]|uniref:Kinase-like domain-containing protein n=1 Tax=Gigaspora rosea TaxID=44941 RepID=A0A397UB69_9GLOM|nr:kinase-like domain-containing protein [Gigaspora rosea]